MHTETGISKTIKEREIRDMQDAGYVIGFGIGFIFLAMLFILLGLFGPFLCLTGTVVLTLTIASILE